MREDKLLMSAKEVQAYLGIGINSVRKMMREPNPFTVQIGNRRYANKEKLKEYIMERCLLTT